MATKKNVERCLWLCVVIFVSYLLLGSFVVSKNYLELIYLIIFYSFLIVAKLIEKNSSC